LGYRIRQQNRIEQFEQKRSLEVDWLRILKLKTIWSKPLAENQEPNMTLKKLNLNFSKNFGNSRVFKLLARS